MPEVKVISYTTPIIEPWKSKEHSPETLGEFIAYCARVSNPKNQMNTETSDRLLSYCIKNKHWSIFEMANIVVEIKTTRDIAHQIVRHRSFSFQEFSQRYAEVGGKPTFRDARLQDTKNRQNSFEIDDAFLQNYWTDVQQKIWAEAQYQYKQAIERGIAKEVARAILPEGLTPTTLFMNGSVRSWWHYVELRTSPGTQKEHREVALKCGEKISEVFPLIKQAIQQ